MPLTNNEEAGEPLNFRLIPNHDCNEECSVERVKDIENTRFLSRQLDPFC